MSNKHDLRPKTMIKINFYPISSHRTTKKLNK